MDVLDALRELTSLDSLWRRKPSTTPAAVHDFPWEKLADLAVVQGVAPIVAYAMEFRLGGAGAPEDIHDALLGYYHGTLTDNVYKLMELKKLLSGAEDVPVVLLEAAAYADSLYPHVAFRAIPDVRLLVRRKDFQALALAGEAQGMRLQGQESGAVLLSDGRTRVLLHDSLYDESGIHERGIAAKAFGPRVRRPAIEDAILTQVALMAKSGFASPLIDYVDLRELVGGSPSQSSVWERKPDAAALKARAQAVGLSRALWCAVQVLVHFFPEREADAKALEPELTAAVRAVLQAGIVAPSQDLERTSVNRAAEEVRKLLV
jgi:hypothetical protein